MPQYLILDGKLILLLEIRQLRVQNDCLILSQLFFVPVVTVLTFIVRVFFNVYSKVMSIFIISVTQ